MALQVPNLNNIKDTNLIGKLVSVYGVINQINNDHFILQDYSSSETRTNSFTVECTIKDPTQLKEGSYIKVIGVIKTRNKDNFYIDCSEVEKVKRYPSAIFICKSCRLACVALPSSWIIPKRKKETPNIHVNAKPYIENTTLYITSNQPDEWMFREYYSEIVDKVSERFYFDFPLCDCCMKKALSMGFCQFSFSQALDVYLAKISVPENVGYFMEDITYRIQKFHVENRDFAQAKKLATDQKFIAVQPKRADILEKQDNENDNNNKYNPNPYRLPRFRQVTSFRSCTLHTVFLFSFNRHYATINGFRLGSQTPDPVPRREVDIGLFFLCQFVAYLGKMVGVNVTDIRTGSFMEVKTEHGTFTEVHFPSQKSKKKYDVFNVCMTKLFQICYNIFSNPFINDSQRRPPFQIDLSAKTIGDLPYKFSKKDPCRWTRVMKLLAIDFKTIQFLALENFINSPDLN